jgi:hypothetical protein
MNTQGEWTGQTSSKFTTNRKHVEPIVTTDPAFRQLYNSMGKRTTYHNPNAEELSFKPSVRQIPQPIRNEKP